MDERIYDRVINAHTVLSNEQDIEARVQKQQRSLIEIDDTYDAITSIADNGGVNNILGILRKEPPAGKNAGEELQSRQQGRNLRKHVPGRAKPNDPENIDDNDSIPTAMKPKRSRMLERLHELMEDEGVLHTGFDENGDQCWIVVETTKRNDRIPTFRALPSSCCTNHTSPCTRYACSAGRGSRGPVKYRKI